MFQELNMNKIMSSHAVGALAGLGAILVLLQYARAQTQHVVGGDLGWTIPLDKSAYQTWANKQKISVGDILIFNFMTNAHNVVEVPKESYESCSSNSSIKTINIGPANFTLNKAGEYHYMCSYNNGGHCKSGQKLAITVSGSAYSPTYNADPPPPNATTSPPQSSAPITSTISAFASFLLLLFSTFMVVMF